VGGINDDEIEDIANLSVGYPLDVRFIELMPMYDSGDFGPSSYINSDIVLKKLPLTPIALMAEWQQNTFFQMQKAV